MSRPAATTREPSRHPLRRWGLKIGVALVIALIGNLILLIRESQDGNTDRLARLKTLERQANPFMLRFAGTLPLGLARLEHRGRRTGRHYATPLLAEPVGAGFMIALPYGPDADWAQNLTAAGGGMLQHNGTHYQLTNPRIMTASEAQAETPALLRALIRLLDIRNVMRVDAAPVTSHPSPATHHPPPAPA